MHIAFLDVEVDIKKQNKLFSRSRALPPRTRWLRLLERWMGSDIRIVRFKTFAIVARHPFRIILPVSARASCSRSMTSSKECWSPTIERTSSRLCASGKIRSALPANGPSKDCCTATSFFELSRSTSFDAASRVTNLTEGTDSRTCSPTICRRLLAARLTPMLAISASASCSISVSVACVLRSCRQFLQPKRGARKKRGKGFICQGFRDEARHSVLARVR